jgi:hypothetical protein
MGLFAMARPMREVAADSVGRASAATRRTAREVAGSLNERTVALGKRGADMLETTAQSMRARPGTAVAIVAALAAVAVGAAIYLAYQDRD